MPEPYIFSPAQVRMARSALRWSLEYLAFRAEISAHALASYEAGQPSLSRSQQIALGRELYMGDTGNGLRPLPASAAGEGVRFRRPRRR